MENDLFESNVLIVNNDLSEAREIGYALGNFNCKIIGITDSPKFAIQSIEEYNPDLILIDLNLSKEMGGVGFASIVNEKYNIPFIYISDDSNKEIMKRAVATSPWAYLIKPLDKPDLLWITIQIVLTKARSMKKAESTKNINGSIEGVNAKVQTDSIFIKNGVKRNRIVLKDILYMQADSNYTHVFTKNNDYLITLPLKVVEGKVKAENIVRIHRKYSVNIDNIDSISADHPYINGKFLPVGSSYKENLKDKLVLL